jgi:hypothetical protein
MKMLALRVFNVVFAGSLAALTIGELHGILINGNYGGTQLYDPFNSPHASGNLHLGLQTLMAAVDGAAVINGPLAYFGGGGDDSDDGE